MRHSHRRPASVVAVVIALAALAGCRNAAEPLDARLLAVTTGGGNVTLINRTDEPIAYRIATERYLALVDPPPCSPSEAPCAPTIEARGRVAVPYTAIGGYAPGERSAVLIDWTDRDPHAAGIRTERVTFPLR